LFFQPLLDEGGHTRVIFYQQDFHVIVREIIQENAKSYVFTD